MSKLSSLIVASLFFFGCSTTELKTPTSVSKFEESYKGVKPKSETAAAIIPCPKSEIVKLEPGQFSYDEVVESEYRSGNVEVGYSAFQDKPIISVENKIESFAKDIGACKVFWTEQDIIDPSTNQQSSNKYYGVSYFAKIEKNAIAGFHPGEPSINKKKEMDRYYGVEVRAIMPETAAERMGLKEKDIILFINQQRCTYEGYIKNGCGVNTRWNVIRIYRDGNVFDIKS